MKRLVATAGILVAMACGGDLSPRIHVFTASPNSIGPGQSTQLVFSVGLASSISIDQGGGDVTGRTSIIVSPTTTTIYTLTATRTQMGRGPWAMGRGARGAGRVRSEASQRL